MTLAPFPGFESVSGSHLWISRLGLAGDIQDMLLADIPAANAFLLKLSQGIAGESTTRPENRVHFTKLSGEVTRLQDLLTIGRVRTALKVSVGGQYTGRILPPSEKYFLGGTRFGRGFFSGEVSGDRAIGSTIELQANTGFSELPFAAPEYRLPAQFYGFWDYGRGFNLAPGDISKTVQSVGLGVRSDLTSWLFGEIEGVHRLTIHPQGANVTEKGYAFFARVTLHY